MQFNPHCFLIFRSPGTIREAPFSLALCISFTILAAASYSVPTDFSVLQMVLLTMQFHLKSRCEHAGVQQSSRQPDTSCASDLLSIASARLRFLRPRQNTPRVYTEAVLSWLIMKQESAGSIPIRYVKEFSGRHEHVIVSIATRSRMADTVKCSVRHESFLCKETFYLTVLWKHQRQSESQEFFKNCGTSVHVFVLSYDRWGEGLRNMTCHQVMHE